MRRHLLVVVIGFALIASARANSVVFSTFGPGDSFDMTASWAVHGAVGSPSGLPLLIAAQFTAQASGNLVSVDLGMRFSQSFGPGLFNLYLYNDSGGVPDASTAVFLGSDGSFGTFTALVSLPVSGTVSVSAGSSYWLSLQPALENAWCFWDFSSPLLLGTIDYSRDGATWFLVGTSQEMPAFRLTATSTVPDSSCTIILLATSSLVLVGLRRYDNDAIFSPR